MKVVITTESKEKSEKVSEVFGRCKYFAVYDKETKKLSFIDNPGAAEFRGAGIAAAQEVVNQGVSQVITGNVGPNAIDLLESNKVEVTLVSGKTLQEVIDELLS